MMIIRSFIKITALFSIIYKSQNKTSDKFYLSLNKCFKLINAKQSLVQYELVHVTTQHVGNKPNTFIFGISMHYTLLPL